MMKKILAGVLAIAMLGTISPIITIANQNMEGDGSKAAITTLETEVTINTYTGEVTLSSIKAANGAVNTLRLTLTADEAIDFTFNEGANFDIQECIRNDMNQVNIYVYKQSSLFDENASVVIGHAVKTSSQKADGITVSGVEYVYSNRAFPVASDDIIISLQTPPESETEESTTEATTTTAESTTTETTTTTAESTTTETTTTTAESTTEETTTTAESTTEETTTTAESTTEETTTTAESTTEETTTTAESTTEETTTTAESTTEETTTTTKATTTTTPAARAAVTTAPATTTTKVTTTTTAPATTTTKVTTTTTAPATTTTKVTTTTTAPATTTTKAAATTTAPATTTTKAAATTTAPATTTTKAAATTEETTTMTEETTTTTEETTTMTEETTTTTEETAATTEETTATTAETTTKTAETTTKAVKHITSDKELCDWSINDYNGKNDAEAVSAEITEREDDQYQITLTDESGNVLDVYKIDPETGIGDDANNNEVNLPQTGNSSLTNLLIVIGAAMMTAFGFAAVRFSNVFRRKENE